MFKHQKVNKKSAIRSRLHTTQMNYTPFSLGDTSYLEHLSKEIKLRNSREVAMQLRKDWLESNKRKNYQNELDRLTGEMSRPLLPHNSIEHLNDRVRQLKSLVFA